MNEIELGSVCPSCKTLVKVKVKYVDYVKYCDGALAQVAFPYLQPAEREVLISGICPKCWDKMFGASEKSA